MKDENLYFTNGNLILPLQTAIDCNYTPKQIAKLLDTTVEEIDKQMNTIFSLKLEMDIKKLVNILKLQL